MFVYLAICILVFTPSAVPKLVIKIGTPNLRLSLCVNQPLIKKLRHFLAKSNFKILLTYLTQSILHRRLKFSLQVGEPALYSESEIQCCHTSKTKIS